MKDKQDLILEELIQIRTLLEFTVKSRIQEEVKTIASTKERKKIWNLLTGEYSTEEIGVKIQISQRAVQKFVKELSDKNLVNFIRRGYPKRKFDTDI